eukprot:s603_g3.t1
MLKSNTYGSTTFVRRAANDCHDLTPKKSKKSAADRFFTLTEAVQDGTLLMCRFRTPEQGEKLLQILENVERSFFSNYIRRLVQKHEPSEKGDFFKDFVAGREVALERATISMRLRFRALHQELAQALHQELAQGSVAAPTASFHVALSQRRAASQRRTAASQRHRPLAASQCRSATRPLEPVPQQQPILRPLGPSTGKSGFSFSWRLDTYTIFQS